RRGRPRRRPRHRRGPRTPAGVSSQPQSFPVLPAAVPAALPAHVDARGDSTAVRAALIAPPPPSEPEPREDRGADDRPRNLHGFPCYTVPEISGKIPER